MKQKPYIITIKNCRMIRQGSSHVFVVPKAFLNHEILDANAEYDLLIRNSDREES